MKKVLFINHEISPYVQESELSITGRKVTQAVQEQGCEIRTFMPKWGSINERRGQLHEVQRLSGMNIIIDDTDHPLIIKVASIPQTKIQVYFIDNDEYFIKNKGGEDNPENDNFNGERAIFFARGVIETMKKLRWSPDVIHCQGWMSAFVPLYIKEAYKDEPSVCNSKIVTSLFEKSSEINLEDNIKQKIAFKDITPESLENYKDEFSAVDLAKIAIDYSDGIIATSNNIDESITSYAKEHCKNYMDTPSIESAEEYIKFYNSLFEE